MGNKPLFSGLIFDENDQPVEVGLVGSEPCYVVNDGGFRHHILSVDVDKQVLNYLSEQVKGNEDLFTEQTARLLGQDDLFTVAIIQNQLKNLDKQYDQLLQSGIPEEGIAYLGMMGFRIVINHHGEVTKIEQPGMIDDGEQDGE